MGKFTATFVDDSGIKRKGPGGNDRPVLADDFAELLAELGGVEKFLAGEKSAYMLLGEFTPLMVRNAAKYHGLSVNISETTEKTPRKVFRFNGPVQTRPRTQKDEVEVETVEVAVTKGSAKK